MKSIKLSPLLTMAMAVQMIISPVAYGQQRMNTLDVLNMGQQIIQQNQMNIAAQQRAQANQALVGQMTQPGRDKYFNGDMLSRIPGLGEYIVRNNLNVDPRNGAPRDPLTCSTLPTTLTEIRSELCRSGVATNGPVPPQAQLMEIDSLYKTYGEVKKVYENFSSSSNSEDQAFGVGCMKNALQVLNGFFAYRLNELDKLTTNLEALNAQFAEASKVDLDAIAESTAVLNGGSNELVDEVRSRENGKDLFNFAKRFDNPACKSMFAGEALNDLGSQGGLNQISRRMKDEFSAKSGKFSGESYIGAHGTVVDDINRMADKAAQQFQLNFTGITSDDKGFNEFIGGLPGAVSSTSGVNNLLKGDFFADSQMNFNKQNSKILSDLSTLRNELQAAGADPSGALRIANNLSATNFESEVGLIQNQIHNSCLQRSFSGGSQYWARIRKNITSPSGSSFANKNEFNSIRERIEEIMTNPRTTPQAKISALQALEASEGSRYVLNMQGSYQKTVLKRNGEVETTTVAPSSKAPSAYFSDIVSTCEAQFSVNKLGSSMTGAGAIQKLRDINQQYKTLATSQSNNIRSEIRKKLIECDTANEANNQQAGSCTKDRFNTASAGFCANAAFTCATNMNSCKTQADNFVKQIKTERAARVTNYKNLVTKNKADIVKIFDTALAKYMAEGEAMRGLFGEGFTSPSGIQRDVAGDKYLGKFRDATSQSEDGALLLEDPEKYVEMFKGNIAKLKNAVQEQQQKILGGRNGLLAQHIEQTERNYQKAMADAGRFSEQCVAKYDQFHAQMLAQANAQEAERIKKMNELGEKRQELCSRFGMLDSNPSIACQGQLRELVDTGLRFSNGSPRDVQSVQDFARECQGNQSESESNSSSNNVTLVASFCSSHYGDEGVANGTIDGTTSAADKVKILCARMRQPDSTKVSNGWCSPRTISGGTNSTPITETNCDRLDAEIVNAGREANRRSDSSSAVADRSDTGGAPAFCTAGFNGDRSVPENGLQSNDAMMQQLLRISNQ